MTHSQPNDVAAWIHRLQSAAAETPADPPPQHSAIAAHAWIENFRDEQGHRPEIYAPFLSWHTGLRGLQPPPDGPPDVMLWWALQNDSLDASRFLRLDDSGPILNQPERTAIEAWTARELRGLHALWHLAAKRDRADWRARCFASASWIIDNLQPDTAPTHPWAIHVFILHALRPARAEAETYAQSLLHNCRESQGRPDRLSGLILQDAAAALSAAASIP